MVEGPPPVADPSSPNGAAAQAASVVVADEQGGVDLDAERWASLAAAVLEQLGRPGELTLTFVDEAEMRALNREHMGVDAPTDVLSFPLDDDPADVVAGPVLLGDVVVCPSVAVAQAATHAGTVDDELALLTVHGVLHVLGHDHADESEATTMRRLELELLVAHHWNGPPPADFRHVHVDVDGGPH